MLRSDRSACAAGGAPLLTEQQATTLSTHTTKHIQQSIYNKAAQLTEEGGRGGRGSRARGFLLRLTMPGSLHCAQWVRLRCPACPKLGTAFPQAHLRDTTLTIPGCMAGGGHSSQQQQLDSTARGGVPPQHHVDHAGCRAKGGPLSQQQQL